MFAAFRLFVLAALIATGAAIVLVSAASLAASGGAHDTVGWFDQIVGTGDVVSDSRSVSSFHAINSNDSTDVHVRVGSPQSVVVRAQRNVADLIETTVDGGTLTIANHRSYTTDKKTEVDIVVPDLDAFSVRGSGDATLEGMHGAALAVTVRGSGTVQATGSVGRLEFNCSGSGDGRLESLAARDAVVRVRGSGTARLRVADTLDVEISGSGDVNYAGSPRIVHQVIRGSGSLAQM